MASGKVEPTVVKTATERRMERIAKRQEKLAEKADHKAPDEMFEKAAKETRNEARGITNSVRAWEYGEIEAEDLMLRLRVQYRDLEIAVSALANAHRLLAGK